MQWEENIFLCPAFVECRMEMHTNILLCCLLCWLHVLLADLWSLKQSFGEPAGYNEALVSNQLSVRMDITPFVNTFRCTNGPRFLFHKNLIVSALNSENKTLSITAHLHYTAQLTVMASWICKVVYLCCFFFQVLMCSTTFISRRRYISGFFPYYPFFWGEDIDWGAEAKGRGEKN